MSTRTLTDRPFQQITPAPRLAFLAGGFTKLRQFSFPRPVSLRLHHPTGVFAGTNVSPPEPEYAQVGLTEAKARAAHDIVTAVVHFDSTTRTVIDGHKFGFCKLIADRKSCKILGCHVIGQRAVDIAEVAAIAIATGMGVDGLARIPLSYPTYAEVLVDAAVSAARQLNLKIGWQGHGTQEAQRGP